MSDDPSPAGDPEPPLAEPAAVPVVPAPDVNGLATTTGLPPNLGAALSMFFLLVGGIVFLFVEKKDAPTRLWAMQSVVLGVVWVVLRIAFAFVGSLLYHVFFPLAWLWGGVALLVNLCLVAVWIVGIVLAFGGKRREIPILGPIARQQLARLGARP